MGNAFSLHRRTLLLASLAAAALPSFPADAAVRRELRYATLGLDTSDPHRHTGSIAVQQCYAEPLTSIADDGQVKPVPRGKSDGEQRRAHLYPENSSGRQIS